MDIPHLHGVFARPWGWISSYENAQQRCTNVNNPAAMQPPYVQTDANTVFAPGEYWHGNQLYVPGVGDQEMLVVMPDNPNKPTNGSVYRWVTPQNWYFSCLPSMATGNNTPGEAFLAIDPNGTRYWFDWAVKYPAPRITKPYGMGPVQAVADPETEERPTLKSSAINSILRGSPTLPASGSPHSRVAIARQRCIRRRAIVRPSNRA